MWRTWNWAKEFAVQCRLVGHRGFEPLISALRGRCPWPLDECPTHLDDSRWLGMEDSNPR